MAGGIQFDPSQSLELQGVPPSAELVASPQRTSLGPCIYLKVEVCYSDRKVREGETLRVGHKAQLIGRMLAVVALKSRDPPTSKVQSGASDV